MSCAKHLLLSYACVAWTATTYSLILSFRLCRGLPGVHPSRFLSLLQTKRCLVKSEDLSRGSKCVCVGGGDFLVKVVDLLVITTRC